MLAAVSLLAACVGNPGEFTVDAGPTSHLNLEDAAGDLSFVLDIGSPSCADGEDNDVDGQLDSGADPECDSAADANERIDGVQAYVETTFPIDIDANGAITADPAELTVGQRELCLGGPGACLGLTVVGTGGTQTGSVGASGVTLPFPVEIEIDPLVGFSGLDAGCSVGPINATLTANSYDAGTGATTLTATDVAVPATSNCGTTWNGLVNDYLGLPTVGNAATVGTILNGDGDPIVIE